MHAFGLLPAAVGRVMPNTCKCIHQKGWRAVIRVLRVKKRAFRGAGWAIRTPLFFCIQICALRPHHWAGRDGSRRVGLDVLAKNNAPSGGAQFIPSIRSGSVNLALGTDSHVRDPIKKRVFSLLLVQQYLLLRTWCQNT